MKQKSFYISLISLSLLVHLTMAQEVAPKKAGYDGPYKLNTWSLTLTPMRTAFFGDLREFDFKRGPEEMASFGLAVGIHKQISPIFGAQIDFSTGNLNGSKARIYNAYFQSKGFLQTSIQGTMNLKTLLFGYNKLKRWKIDAHAGYGYMWFNTSVFELGTGKMLRNSNNTPGSSRTAGVWERTGSTYTREIVIPTGVAIHYEVTPRLDLGLDFTINHVNTEKLDMTVGGVDNSLPTNVFTFKFGNSKKDKWGYVGIALTYKLGKNAIMSKKNPVTGNYDLNAKAGRYNLRYTNPMALIPPPYNPTLKDADSIAKAVMPKPIDPRMYTDTDKDGVSDLFDKEANTPENSIVSGGGVAINFDKYFEALKNRPAAKEECEAMFSNLEFDTDKATLRPNSQETLRKVIDLLNLRPNCRIVIVGHTDARASYGYNMQLAKRRVESAKRFVVRNGLQDPSRVVIEYFGEYRPIAPNTNDPGLQTNRRVEIMILPQNSLRSNYPAGFRYPGYKN